MENLTIEVISPSKAEYTGYAKSVSIPGSAGAFQVLFNHAPIISSYEIGIVKIVDENGDEKKYCTGGGTVEVLKNKVLLLAESFESVDDINVDRAEDSMKRAKERMTIENRKEYDHDRAEASLKRALNRLKLTGSI